MGKYIVKRNFPVTPSNNFNKSKFSSFLSPIAKAAMKNRHETMTNAYMPFLRVIFRTCDDNNILIGPSRMKFSNIVIYRQQCILSALFMVFISSNF